ncbi:magnesium ion transporter [Cryptotrichosporon argae]
MASIGGAGSSSRLAARSGPPQVRTLFTRRGASTSFWSTSYPSDHLSNIPSTPPSPAPPSLPAGSAVVEADEGGRKQRLLDSLMDRAGELSLKCSVLDAEGKWSSEEGMYRKMDLCKAHDLDPRDLRKLDSLTPNLVPLIITRRTCILVSMLHVRALIKPDRVILFNSARAALSPIQRRLMRALERNVRAGLKVRACARGAATASVPPDASTAADIEDEDAVGLAYEHRALESILVETANALEEEMAYTRTVVSDVLAGLEADVNRDNLRNLLHYSRGLVGFQSRAKYVKKAVEEILESDEDLSAMYITARKQGKPRALHDHEQLEMLLESFVKQVEEIVSEVDTTAARLKSTQEVAELMLDSGRNALIALDVKVHVATLGIGVGGLFAGLFGMNLATGIEDAPYAFALVSGSAALAGVAIFQRGLSAIRKVQRVALDPASAASPLAGSLWDPAAHGTGGSTAHAHHAARAAAEHERRWALFRTQAGARASLFDRLFRRHRVTRRLLGLGLIGVTVPPFAHAPQRPTERQAVWINAQADEARARDALRFTEIERERARDDAAGREWARAGANKSRLRPERVRWS